MAQANLIVDDVKKNKNTPNKSTIFKTSFKKANPEPNDIIFVNHFVKKFNRSNIIGPLTFHAKKGRITALLGRSGSGKSVVLNSIVGAIKKYRGQIFVNNIERKTSKNFLASSSIGFYTQMDFSSQKIPCIKFLKNICYTFGIPHNEIDARIEKWLKALSLWEDRNKNLSDFSWGMKNRVNFVLAFIKEPQLLILDEPGANLDSFWRDKIKTVIVNFVKENNASILITVHNVDEMSTIIDDYVIIDEGRLIFTGTSQELNLYRKFKISLANFNQYTEEQLNQIFISYGFILLDWNPKEKSLVVAGNDILRLNLFSVIAMKMGFVYTEFKQLPINMSAIEKALNDKRKRS